ncbi:WGxxGxxG family protein [Nostoc sp. NMS4]|uniref:WGxxGxxG family protein n=1 Tax=Nostoc sp. NMS4 TaxID=2815390 RepID=UPI0025E95ECE|nr:WGxxGxxG family protein [Nostoc sp. NMS4]
MGTDSTGNGTTGSGTTGTDSTGTGTTGTDATGTNRNTGVTTSERTSDRGFDWGWLGLLGLAGLAGLRNREKVRAYSDPDEVTGSRIRK